MNLNTRKPFQIGALLLALTMLASYVVYSQRQGSQNVAPGSKSGGIDVVIDRTAIPGQEVGTNRTLHRSLTIVAPSSKSISPLLAVPATRFSKTATNVAKVDKPGLESTSPADIPVLGLTPTQWDRRLRSDPRMLLPSSKSAAVFHPQDVTILMPHSPPTERPFPAPLPQVSQPFKPTTLLPVSGGTNVSVSLKP